MAVSEVRHDRSQELQVNNSSHTKGTIHLVNERMGTKEMVFECGRTNGHHKTHDGWTGFLHCRFTDSM